jgi:hypothetical protein
MLRRLLSAGSWVSNMGTLAVSGRPLRLAANLFGARLPEAAAW